jgi:peptidoglycan hydrolase-like protein with peptidoglycan-binding domain
MRLCHSSILIFTCLTCLGFYPHPASVATSQLSSPDIEEASSAIPALNVNTVIIPGSQGEEVKRLQIKLKDLGYYNGEIDGLYGRETQNAVLEFQKFRNLRRTDGIADVSTRDILQTAWISKNPIFTASVANFQANNSATTANVATTDEGEQGQRELIWWSLLGLGILGTSGALLFLLNWFRHRQNKSESTTNESPVAKPAENKRRTTTQPVATPENVAKPPEKNVSVVTSQSPASSVPTAVLPPDMTARLTKLSVVEQLIQDLRSNDRSKRRKAIWGLGQQGDSRAIQPLVDLMINADSQQRSLILAALAEINARSLRPMNRALAISLQDESPQVRQNAIRDLTRVYDMMSQMSQMLAHAVEDPDVDVQTTAKYALNQMNQMRGIPNQQSLPQDHQQPKSRKL